MTKPTIRSAGWQDLNDLVEIDRACFPESLAYDEREIGHYLLLDSARTLIAQVEERVAGFLILEGFPFGRRATLVTLDVIAPYRRSGVGSALLRSAERILTEGEIAHLELQVDTTNESAIRFYKSHGFRILGRLPGYYPTGKDAYLMRKRVPASGETSYSSNKGLSFR